MSEYASSMKKLVEALKRLPGIGPKSAQRLAFHILKTQESEVKDLALAMVDARKNIKHCSTCFNVSDRDCCEICSDLGRDATLLCVVEEPKDLIAIERSRSFRGLYHVLGGTISPLDGFGPENLRVKELLERIKKNKVSEIVLAINPTTEGEITSTYLIDLLKPLGQKLTRIAFGLPVGGDLDYADEATLSKSMNGRREVHA